MMPTDIKDIAAVWELTESIPRFNLSRLDNGKWRILLAMPHKSQLNVEPILRGNGKGLLKMKTVEGDSAAHVICLAVKELHSDNVIKLNV